LSSAAHASPFLSAEIESAISERSEFLRQCGLADKDFISLESWIETHDLQQFRERLDAADDDGPWRHYIRGLIADDGDAAGAYYGRALEAAEADAGALWLLSLEFIRYEQYPWAEATFEALDKLILAGGGSAASAPLLSQKLMLMGNAMAANSPEQAEFCYAKAHKFDSEQPWWGYKKGEIDFPRNVMSAAPGFFVDSWRVISTSWRAQLSLLCGLYRYFAATLFIFVCAVFLVFIVKYLPEGVHSFGDLLFLGAGASPRFRTAASVIIILSALIFGLVPTLWITAFLMCRPMASNEKKLLFLACVILTLSPLNHYVTNFLQHNLRPDSPAVLLDRAVREGYSEGLHKLTLSGAQSRPESHASQLALAVSAAKKPDNRLAAEAIDKALNLAPNDAMTLMYAGNISFWAGDTDKAEQYFGDLSDRYPWNARAKYNLAQTLYNEGGFTASDMITEAAQADAALVGYYMRENERHFEERVPTLRRVMQPPVTPGYFWSRLFFSDIRGAFGNSGKAVPAISPIALFGLFALLLLTLLALNAALWGGSKPRARSYFVCRVCGRLLCRKCRKGTMCSECYKAGLDSHNNAAAMYNRQRKFQDSALLRRDITKCLLGIAVPGTDKLYKGEKVFGPVAAMLLTSAIFAAYYCALTFSTNYPGATTINPLHFVPVLLIYNVVALIKQCTGLASTLKVRAKMSPKT